MLHLTIREIDAASFRQDNLLLVHEWRDVAGSVCAHGYVGEGVNWIRWPGFVAFRFDESGFVEAYPEGRADPGRIQDLFNRTVEPLILQALGWETIHASAVMMPTGVAAFCGDCKSGKSTIAYSLSRRGYRQYADDSMVVQPGLGGVRSVSLPFGVRLRPESASFLGFTSDDREFQDVAPISRPESRTVSTSLVSALFVLSRVSSGEPSVRRLVPPEAFKALLPHARSFNSQNGTERRRVLEHYLEIVAAVPVYELRFPSGLEHLGAVLDCIERSTAVPEAEPV